MYCRRRIIHRLLCQQCMTQVVQSLSAAHSSSRSSTSASSDNVDTSSSGGKGWSSSGGDINRTPASGGSAPNAAPVDEDERVSTIADSISASRQTKIILTRASQLFSERPELGFDYLQTHGLLTKPLTPNSVAKFLRISPRLSIEKIGAYLGELGTKNARHESASVEFHKQVLSDYIKSFEFTGQSLLDAVRIFLSAFLLPKEAQQIDRIFVAFAEHCHQSCAECVSGVLQNSDVTYLMTISIIMLNTDRHNANIPPHKKMTLQKFVQVNKNYGADLKQTQDVPVTYLEKIFHSIDQFPLRTDRNDLLSQHAVKHFSVAVWQDMQLQQSIFPERGFLTTASFAPALLEGFSREFAHASDSKGGKSHKHGTEAYEGKHKLHSCFIRSSQLPTNPHFS